ncbi:phosphoglycerate mutase-like protein [Coniophora puteana RWD-64-598 SS2]|uniref:Phosphoglycerate mutase-like protein n=1 Tax=Coniophora puteana (strain RWD-64-598) TaxID=741705 RepID=A0A5M3MUL0_CONPW|nr:phosphoglycerate mutase-like protein [Coniophora puteana RWD-64-598 SS2]EIW82796.1 phosphoglycerate mutase-like protein [Coniophora puteana RWD-64-598 SS2]
MMLLSRGNALLSTVAASLAWASAAGAQQATGASYAGSTVTAAYPPTNDTSYSTYFPDATQVGYPGPTPTGAEPEAIATAAFAPLEDANPLTPPSAAGSSAAAFDVLRYWGNLSPQYTVPSFGLPDSSPQIPEGCGLNQVHLLMRHGARYPTSGGGPADFAAKLHAAATGAGFVASGDLEFLGNWTYKLGAEILTSFGRKQLFDEGIRFRMRYGELLNGFTELPVFRTTSEDRMVDSALNFAAGFFEVRTYLEDYYQSIIVEADGFNNTLAPYGTCNNSNVENIGYYGDGQGDKWADIYLQSALKRLQPQLKGVNLTVTDLVNMQEMCSYETVALGFSVFCDLFTPEEWEGFEYLIDLQFWYSEGPGNPTSAAMGLGWVQELVARLTETPITVWNSTTNSTLDNSNITFPLNQPIYVDATHDTVISNIVTALNFTTLAAVGPLPTDHIPPNRSYIVSQIAPFASNLIAQVLSCPASEDPTHIRFVLNDAVVPLTGIAGCDAEDKNGLCALPGFISGMQTRIGEIDFDFDCFANYTMPQPDEITDGRYPAWLRNGTSSA